ncbi:hypothetical protein Goklo_017204, partial [Gossypium klotzschianum]|nr:hypothetical protein [Gossypium klotzschianum]
MDFRRVEFKGDSLLVITKMKSTATNRSDISMLVWEAKLLGQGWFRHNPWCGVCGVVTCWTLDFSTIMMVAGTGTSDLGYWQRCDRVPRLSTTMRDNKVFLPLELGISTVSLIFEIRAPQRRLGFYFGC